MAWVGCVSAIAQVPECSDVYLTSVEQQRDKIPFVFILT